MGIDTRKNGGEIDEILDDHHKKDILYVIK